MRNRYYNYAITKCGKSHISKEIPNQDAVLYRKLSHDDDLVVMAAADGVSSCAMAGHASHFLVDKLGSLVVRVFNEYGDMDMERFRRVIDELHQSFTDHVWDNHGDINEYGSTLEAVILFRNIAYTLHAGDGLICVFSRDGHIDISNNDHHSGTEPGTLYPFSVKDRWEFAEYSNVYGALITTDGVADELIPAPARRYGFSYDISLLAPLFDIRAHRTLKQMKHYVEAFISGELDDRAVYNSARKILKTQGSELQEHFDISRPYAKFCNSRDDLSIVLCINDKSGLPDSYGLTENLPDYYQLWKNENELIREHASRQLEMLGKGAENEQKGNVVDITDHIRVG